uniref:Putative ovule protein n=1 Tax=Solanum chacoense TaxID=4108 RepID=A0A0V0HUC7_SOLCH
MILLTLKTSRTQLQPNGPKVAKKIGFQLCFRLFLSFYSTNKTIGLSPLIFRNRSHNCFVRLQCRNRFSADY